MKLFFLISFLLFPVLIASGTSGADALPAPLQDLSITAPAPLNDHSISQFRFDSASDAADDDDAASNFKTALESFKGGDYAGAAQAAEKIMKNYSGSPWEGRAVFLAARAYGVAGDLKKAADYFQLSKEKLKPLSGYADFLLAEQMRKKGNYTDSLKLYLDAAREARVVSVESVLQAGEICLLLGRYSRAIELVRPLLNDSLSSGSAARADYLMTVALAGAGERKEAIKYYSILWQEYPGLSFEPKAKKRLKELNIKIPSFGAAEHMQRARACIKHCLYDEALELYREAYKLEKKSSSRAEALFGQGECYYHLKDNRKAEKAIRAALDRKLPPERASEAYLLLARIYLREGESTKFRDTIGRCSEKYPHERETAEALYLLGTVLSQEGNLDGALIALGKLSSSFPSWPRADEALWQTGWAQFKKKDYKAAEESFSKLSEGYPNSSLSPQALYWRAKALSSDGSTADAETVINKLKTSYPYSFYGLLASLPSRIFPDGPDDLKMPEPGDAGEDVMDEPPASPDARLLTAYELGVQGLNDYALKELRRAESLFDLPREADKITEAYHFLGEYKRPLELISSEWSRSSSAGGKDLPDKALHAMFPLVYWNEIYLEAKAYGMDPWIIISVIREESHCSPQAVSPVGAVGLMQLMKGTSDIMCRKMNVDSPDEEELKNGCFNIPIGSFYLRQLLKKHGGRLSFALAEYNAGPGGLDKWKAKAGDMPDDFFIENIDYAETRGYVKKVLRNYFMYKKLYSVTPPF